MEIPAGVRGSNPGRGSWPKLNECRSFITLSGDIKAKKALEQHCFITFDGKNKPLKKKMLIGFNTPIKFPANVLEAMKEVANKPLKIAKTSKADDDSTGKADDDSTGKADDNSTGKAGVDSAALIAGKRGSDVGWVCTASLSKMYKRLHYKAFPAYTYRGQRLW
jgi:hypothetical protein